MKSKALLSGMMILLFLSLSSLNAVEGKYRVIKLMDKGWIKGRVTHTAMGMDVPRIEVERNVSVCGIEPRAIQAVQVGPAGALRNAVVYLKDISAGKGFLMSGTAPTLTQQHCDFLPHVQLVTPFSSVRIVNNDEILHSVHAYQFPLGQKFVLYPNSISYPANTLFNIAMVAQRKESFQQLGEPGIVKTVCDAGHYWMTAYFIVMPHPYFVKVDDDGNYTIQDVPPGKYTLVSWHEYFGSQERVIQVRENQPVVADFSYSSEL